MAEFTAKTFTNLIIGIIIFLAMIMIAYTLFKGGI